MHTYLDVPIDWEEQLQQLSPQALAYVRQLEKEAAIIQHYQLRNGYKFLTCQTEAFMNLFAGELSPADADGYHDVYRTTLLVTREAMDLYCPSTLVPMNT
ncbi:MAG: hypothetical protein AAFO02_00575 [Bacteroidota bacterium]